MDILENLDLNHLRSRLSLDITTGNLFWNPIPGNEHHHKIWNANYAGRQAGCRGDDGYTRIEFEGKKYLAHRLIWFYVHGEIPPNEIDHIDRDNENNAPNNLRLATGSQNKQNRTPVGTPGVGWHKHTKRYRAYIKLNGRTKHLGLFKRLEDAIAARKAEEQKLFGEFVPDYKKAIRSPSSD